MNQLASAVPRHESDSAHASPTVRAVLKELGIRPFTPESVAAYKALMVHKLRPRWWDRLGHKIEERITLGELCGQAFRLSLSLFLVGLVSFGIGLWLSIPHVIAQAPWLVLAGSVGTVLFWVLERVSWGWDYRKGDAEWVAFGPVGTCTCSDEDVTECMHCLAEMPDNIARLARQVQTRLPEARLYVEELLRETRFDPLLGVNDGNDDCHFAVWDEDPKLVLLLKREGDVAN
jgi:hypothetical protein